MHGASAWNVSTRRKGPRPETRHRDLLDRDRDETETLSTLSKTRPRRDVSTSWDGLETETSRPRPHPCQKDIRYPIPNSIGFDDTNTRSRYRHPIPEMTSLDWATVYHTFRYTPSISHPLDGYGISILAPKCLIPNYIFWKLATLMIRGKSSMCGANSPVGESSKGRNVQVAKYLGGKSSTGWMVQGRIVQVV